MGQEMEAMHGMIQNVGTSMEMQEQERKDFEAQVKMYEAETKRIATVQAGMSEQQIQDIAMGVVAAAMESQNMIYEMPGREQNEMMPESAEYAPEMMPPQGMPPMPPQGMPQ
jgi:hypothetical protein